MTTVVGTRASAASWRWFAAAGSLGLVVYLWLPGLAQTVVYDALGIAACLAILFGVRLHRPARPAPWYLLASGLAAWMLGDLAFSAYELAGETPFPSVADGLYLSGYPMMFAAVALLVHRTGSRNAAAWQDAFIWVIAALLLSFEWLIEPNASDPDSTVAAQLVAVAYPVMDLGLLLFIVRLLSGRGRRAGIFGALAVALALYVISDTVYGVQALAGTYVSGSWVDLGWMGCAVITGAAALHPRMVDLTEPGRVAPRLSSRSRFIAVTGAALLAPGLLAYQSIWGTHVDGAVIAVAAASLFVLCTLRGLGLLQELEHASSELRSRERELHRRATTDSLTGLANRAALLDHLAEGVRRGQASAVALLDLDGFKQINDTLGHQVGDALLQTVGRRLQDTAEPGEFVARLGGDEFALVSRTTPAELGARVLAALESPAVLHGSAVRVRASVGLAVSGRDGTSVSDLLRSADVAMYDAKSAGGRGCSEYDPKMSAERLARVALCQQLTEAVEREEFVPHFQAVVDLDSYRLIGFEALARWSPAGGRLRPPAEWMLAAEQNGLVGVIDTQILRLAARQLAAWSARIPGAGSLMLAVNASGHTLQDPDVAERMLDVLREEGLDPSRIVLELTEGILIDDEMVGSRLQRLRAAGVRVALDDFGTGWSSLAYLRRFPVDILKLDRSFVAGLGSGPAGEAVPAAVLQLASSLQLEVVAEGVETPEQAAALRQLGCRQAQGYLLGRPAASDDLERVVARGRVEGGPVLSALPVVGFSQQNAVS